MRNARHPTPAATQPQRVPTQLEGRESSIELVDNCLLADHKASGRCCVVAAHLHAAVRARVFFFNESARAGDATHANSYDTTPQLPSAAPHLHTRRGVLTLLSSTPSLSTSFCWRAHTHARATEKAGGVLIYSSLIALPTLLLLWASARSACTHKMLAALAQLAAQAAASPLLGMAAAAAASPCANDSAAA